MFYKMEKKYLMVVILCFLQLLHIVTAQPTPYGCYQASDPRNFTVSAGGFNPDDTGSSNCYAACSDLGYQYSALTLADTRSYCLCPMGVDSGQITQLSECSATCSAGSTDCGSATRYNTTFNVFEVPSYDYPKSTVTSTDGVDPRVTVAIKGNITFSTTVTGSSNLGYLGDFGQGAGMVKTRAADFSKTFIEPGEYDVLMFISDPSYSATPKASMNKVSVQGRPMVSAWECPEISATYEELCCNATITSGTYLTANVDFVDVEENLIVSDTVSFSAGPGIPETTDSYSVGSTSDLVVDDARPFTDDGVIQYFEYLGGIAGSFKIVILSKVCNSGTYCFETNMCGTTCNPYDCSNSNAYSPSHTSCVQDSGPSAPPPTDLYAAPPGLLTVKEVRSITLSSDTSNSQVVDISDDPISVSKGDILGYVASTGKLRVRPTSGTEKGVYTATGITNPSQGSSISSYSSRSNQVFFMRAIAVKQNLLLACHTYMVPNLYTVSLNLSNILLNTFTLNTTTINVVEGINATEIENAQYGVLGEKVNFTILPHTGSNITYTWFFGDGSTDVVYEPFVSHIFSEIGIYNVNVTSANMVSSKDNTSAVVIERRITNLKVDAEFGGSTHIPHAFNMTMDSGSDYKCTWDFGDGPTEETTEAQTPTGGSNYTHIFTLEKENLVSVTCTNNVSTDTATVTVYTIAAIKNIQLVKTGGIVNQPLWLNWTLDSGTNATFFITFDSITIPNYEYDETTKYGYIPLASIASTGIKEVVINGANVVSNETLVANFTIEEEITNPVCSQGQVNIKVNESLTFNCTMDGGTSVQILWNYTDGDTDEHGLQTLERWTPGSQVSKSHMFLIPGIFKVKTTVSNNFNEFDFIIEVAVYNGIDGVSMIGKNPSMFDLGPETPPAEVCFTTTEQYPPVNASVFFTWGDGETEMLPFQIGCFSHRYRRKQNYTVKATVANLVDSEDFTDDLYLVNIITNMQLFPSDAVTVSNAMNVCITLDAGDLVQLSCDFDFPNGLEQTRARTAMTPYEEDCFSHTYSSEGRRTIRCKSTNPVMNVTKDYVVTVQEPVRPECYNLTASPDYTIYPNAAFTLSLVSVGGAGCPTPTAAKMSVSWKDSKFDTAATSLSVPQTFTNTYSAPGEYDCVVLLHNDVSRVTFKPTQGKCRALEQLGTMTVEALYRPAIPIGGPAIPGYGPTKTSFSIDDTVIFDVKLTQGTVSTYTVIGINSNQSTITVCDFNCEEEVTIKFDQPGEYNVTITASNPLESRNLTTTVYMSDIPAGLNLTTPEDVYAPGQPALFYVNTETLGERTCFDVSLDDGNQALLYGHEQTCTSLSVGGVYQGAWLSSMMFNVTYTESRVTTVTVCGRNYVSAKSPVCQSLSFPVSTGCDVPKIEIPDQSTSFFAPESKLKCKDVIIDATVSLTGSLQNADWKNTKNWTVERLNASTGEVIETVNLNRALTYTKLFITGNVLDYGPYKLTLTVTLTKGTGSSCTSSVYTYINIIKCPLVANFAGFGIAEGVVGFNKTISFRPLNYSYDPDISNKVIRSQGISCQFRCRLKQEEWPKDVAGNTLTDTSNAYIPDPNADPNTLIANRKMSGCFSQGPGYVNGSGAGNCNLDFNTASMYENATYIWEVQIFKDARSASWEYTMTVVPGDPPQMIFTCLPSLCKEKDDGLLFINVRNKLRIKASPVDGSPGNSLSYNWEFFCIGRGSSLLPIHNIDDYVRDLKSQDIAATTQLLQDKFVEYGRYCDLKVKLEVSRDGGIPSETSTKIYVNNPPVPGTCSVSPQNGTEGITDFTISCSGWTDDNGIRKYTTYAHYESGNIIVKSQVTEAFGQFSSWTGPLPSGVDKINNKLESRVRVTVEVLDLLGGKTEFDLGNVTISTPNPSESDQIEAKLGLELDKLTKKSAEGNEEQVLDLALKLSVGKEVVLENIILRTQCDASSQDCSAQEKQRDKEMSNLALSMEKTAESISNLQMIDISSSKRTLSAAYEVVKDTSIMTLEVQSTILNACGEASNIMDRLAEDTSQEDMAEAATPLVNLIERASKGLSDIMYSSNTLSLVMDRAVASPFYKYDNSLEGSSPDISGLPPAEAQAALNRQTLSAQTSSQSSTGSTQIDDAYTKLTRAAIKTVVAGEGPMVIATEGNSTVFTVESNSAAKILNKEMDIGGSSSISLGSLSDLMGVPADSVDNSTQITIAAVKSDVNYVFQVANSFINQPITRIEIFSGDSPLRVSNSSKPIIISVPKGSPKMIAQPTPNVTNSGLGEMDQDGYQNFNVSGFPLMSHKVNIPLDQSNASVLFEIEAEDQNAKYMVLSQCNRLNTWNASGNLEWDYGTVDYLPREYSSMKTWMMTGTKMNVTLNCYQNLGSRTNLQVFVAIYQVNNSLFEDYRYSGVPVPHNATIPMTAGYKVRNQIIGCYYLDTITNSWAMIETSENMLNGTDNIQCATRHLTAFSSGVAVAPNPIDWAFVFANADFFKNMTLYITEIIIAVMYIIAAVWARRQDNKDVEKLGLTPLIGNKPEDKYLYEIFIATGHRRNAGTESKVYLILSGDYDETEPALIAGPGKKKLLQRSSTDGVLLTTSRPLGSINYLRIWHDNSGKGSYASWYLKYIMVHDLQTKEKYFFISDQWFAVEEGDGQVDRVVPVSGLHQMTEFKHLFSHTSQKNLGDDHLWYSVVARPPESRFTRLQRVSCCLLLLFTNMLANGLFYERAKTGTSNAFTLGPFSLTMEQLYVGMITNLIIFPINFIVVMLFRKSPPRKKRKSRIQEALEAQQLGSDLITDDNEKLVSDKEMISPTPRSARMVELETRTPRDVMQSSGSEDNKTMKKKKCELPWWFRIVAWLLLWGAVGASAFFVTMYGIQFGDEKSKKWISSMIISFATSIFLTQPLQVLLTAMLFSAIFKRPSLDRKEAEEDEEKPPLQSNEEWVLPDPELGYPDSKERQVVYQPPDSEALEKARETRLKELKMFEILREIVFYCFFLWLLLVVSYTFRPSIGFTMKDQVRSNFIDQGLRNNYTFMEDFKKVGNHEQFWNWFNITFLPGLVAGRWYNGGWIPVTRGFLADRANRIMGYATMRQLRVRPNTCEIMKLMRPIMKECNEDYSWSKEDTADYGPGWTPVNPNDTNPFAREHYTYRTGAELDSYPFWAEKAIYGGGGYLVELRGSLSAIEPKIQKLIEERWIDRYTRAVFVEFTTYNPGVNLFSIVTIVAEFVNSGGVFPMYRVEPVTLLTHYGPLALFELACQIMYGCFILFYLIKEARNLYHQRRQYFLHFWNWVEMFIIILSVAGTVIFVYRTIEANKLTNKFKETHGNAYIKFQFVGYWQELLIYMVGWLVFLANIKFLKLLRFNQRMSMLAATLSYSAKSLFMFSIMFWITFMAFVQFFYLIYFKELFTFRTIVHATETCMQMMLGRFEFEEMSVASPVLGSLFFIVYIVTVAYIILNMLISILNEGFAKVRADLELQSNEHEMVDFIVQRLRDLLGIGSASDKASSELKPAAEEEEWIEEDEDLQVKPSLDFNIENFPQKIDRLLNCITKIVFFEHLHEKVYFERNGFDEVFESHGALSGAAGKEMLKRMEDKEEMRKMMARFMLSSFATPGSIHPVRKDNAMI